MTMDKETENTVRQYLFSLLQGGGKNLPQEGKFPFSVLKLYVADPALKEVYRGHIEKHNTKVLQSPFPDSGFDLFVPTTTVIETPFLTHKIDLGVIAQMIYCRDMADVFEVGGEETQYSPFLVHPRSSIANTPLLLSNHTGVIDMAYRGNIIIALRLLSGGGETYKIEENTRLTQICHPSYCPILAVLVEKEEIDMNTTRGAGGFGST